MNWSFVLLCIISFFGLFNSKDLNDIIKNIERFNRWEALRKIKDWYDSQRSLAFFALLSGLIFILFSVFQIKAHGGYSLLDEDARIKFIIGSIITSIWLIILTVNLTTDIEYTSKKKVMNAWMKVINRRIAYGKLTKSIPQNYKYPEETMEQFFDRKYQDATRKAAEESMKKYSDDTDIAIDDDEDLEEDLTDDELDNDVELVDDNGLTDDNELTDDDELVELLESGDRLGALKRYAESGNALLEDALYHIQELMEQNGVDDVDEYSSDLSDYDIDYVVLKLIVRDGKVSAARFYSDRACEPFTSALEHIQDLNDEWSAFSELGLENI